jgi:hypothetical protein
MQCGAQRAMVISSSFGDAYGVMMTGEMNPPKARGFAEQHGEGNDVSC